MDVTLPDGTVLRGIPDGTTKAELTAKLKANGMAVPDETPPAKSGYGSEDPGVVEQLVGGAKHAWDRAAEGLESLVPGGRRLSRALNQPDLQELTKQGKQFVKETGPASSVGELAGEVALTAAPGAGAYRAVTALPRVAKAGRLTQAMAGGAGAGAAGAGVMGENPVTGATAGAIMGPMGTVVGDVGGWGWKQGKRLFEDPNTGASRYLRELSIDPNADATVLRGLKGLVPGEQPTAGMAATVDPKMLYMKEIEEQANRRIGGLAEARRQANEAARAAPLEEIAAPGVRGLDRATGRVLPSEAEALRSKVTGPIYEKAMPDRVSVDPNLERILGGAEVLPARNAGARQFSQEQTNFPGTRDSRVSASSPPPEGTRIVRNPLSGKETGIGPAGPFMERPGTYSVEELQLIRRNLDDKINQAAQQGDQMTVRRLSEARNQLSGEMTGQSGNFALANTMFRNLSAPQNQAQVAQTLLDALRSPTGKERASSFLTARRNAPQTLRKSDQSPRFQHEGEVLTPDQLKQVDAITSSLRREADYANLPRMELQGVMSPAEKVEGAIPSWLDRTVTLAKKGLQKLGVRSDEQVRKVIDEAVLDPQKMANLLETLPPADRVPFLSAIREANPKGAFTGYVAGQE